MTVTFSDETLATLRVHACATYPDECCGFVVERDGREEVVRVRNIQNELHARDPQQYPRTAAIAYTMDGRELFAVMDRVERGQLALRAIYHSHPEHDAYFSAEDRTQAMGPWDEPSYPQAAQIVMSVRNGAVVATKAFVWDAAKGDFGEAELGVSSR